MGELTGKRAIVTGGTRGIGFATVVELSRAGADVHFTGTSEANVAAAAARLDGVAATGHAFDVRDLVAMEGLLAGGCDVLVNNAAVAEPMQRLHEADANALRTMFEINLLAAVEWARHAAMLMAGSGGGTIVSISSGAARFAVPNMVPYCISKAGISMASRGLHVELADKGVRVFCFEPGIVDTDMQTSARESRLFEEILPTDRSLLARPEAPARAIRWLCSHGAEDFAGRDLSIGEEDFQRAMEAEPLAD
ncbi:SDR family NAD(P)-dependent oxidoreductase [Altererythrobacter salegens]|uniref:SDR family NAD(P)-dependent oxidoreductase n=1 Tax=Croceibacterium salegens TaxID=1737568 RepID=A0A6I4T210_9SPHN|nr:SDR family oxidoreductase [Croceibacterium salegens]MXO61356.1 SDR family NAD(P)-dependent oxidoreductase [Croceibacterium salegens]